MQERGDIQKFYNKWWKSGGTCIRDEKKDSKANALNVENVGGIFVVLVGGLILAVIVSIIEFIYYARKNSARINVRQNFQFQSRDMRKMNLLHKAGSTK
jgi:ionotropic glutamate receptor